MADAETKRVRYVALYQTGERGKNYFRFVHVEFPAGMIPPFTIAMTIPRMGTHQFICLYEDTQGEIARLYGTTQQTVGRWLKNPAPSLWNTEGGPQDG